MPEKKAPTFPNVLVVGMHFRGPEVKALVSTFVPPVDLEVRRERFNMYDANAIQVFYGDEHIGYIEAKQAQWIAPWMDQGVEYLCVVTDLQAKKNNLHPVVTLTPAENMIAPLEVKEEAPVEPV